MIKNWFITGDAHSKVAERLHHIPDTLNPEETAIIILGDAGFNFWLNKTDTKAKREASKYGYTIYCVRGNHEERPENIAGYSLEHVEGIVTGDVFTEKKYPKLMFATEGLYGIGGYRCFVTNGAYSVDKYHRLENGGKWFEDEQMSAATKMRILRFIETENSFDYILSHCAPLKYEPIHLFLSFIKQENVDKSMEKFLDIVLDKVSFKTWFLGHYHSDEWLNSKTRLLYNDIIEIVKIDD